MYQALYRKWRPKTFNDVIGQTHITKTLQNEIVSNRIGHAYLFIGSRGTGKTTCAKIFAKAVNCLNPNLGDACLDCEICKEIDNSNILDIIELDAASNNGVDDIRNICESANFTPAKAKYKVYIIDEVHMLSPGAFNALLKTLEEPPAHVIFILATTEVHKVPATILSRCQKFEFHKISIEDIIKRLNFIAEREGINLQDEAALTIAKFSDGAMRDALTIFEKCIDFENEITYKKVSKILGITENEYIYDIIDSIIEKNTSKAISIINQLDHESKNLSVFFEELILAFRNIMLIKSLENTNDLITASKSEYEKMKNFSNELSIDKILSILDVLQASFEKLSKTLSVKTEIEMCIVKLTSCEKIDLLSSLTKRIEKLEKIISNQESLSKVILKDKKESHKKNETVETVLNKDIKSYDENINSKNNPVNPILDMESLQKNAVLMPEWEKVLESLKNYSQTIATAFKDSKAYVNGNYVLIDSPKEMAFELLRKSSQRDKMRLAIKEITGNFYKLGPYKSLNKQEEKKDPLSELIESAKDLGINVLEK